MAHVYWRKESNEMVQKCDCNYEWCGANPVGFVFIVVEHLIYGYTPS
jgi:hypothetical protein